MEVKVFGVEKNLKERGEEEDGGNVMRVFEFEKRIFAGERVVAKEWGTTKKVVRAIGLDFAFKPSIIYLAWIISLFYPLLITLNHSHPKLTLCTILPFDKMILTCGM